MKDSKLGALITSSVGAPGNGFLAWVDYQIYLDARSPGLSTAALSGTMFCAVLALVCTCLAIWIITSELVALATQRPH